MQSEKDALGQRGSSFCVKEKGFFSISVFFSSLCQSAGAPAPPHSFPFFIGVDGASPFPRGPIDHAAAKKREQEGKGRKPFALSRACVPRHSRPQLSLFSLFLFLSFSLFLSLSLIEGARMYYILKRL
jgi:hypothetical protein